jgi:hypothetical protein
MVDPEVHRWLAQRDAAEPETALVVQFSSLPEKRILEAPTTAARIQILTSYVKERMSELTRQAPLPPGAVKIMGAIGQAVIQAPASTLARLIAPSSGLATATDCEVKPNVLMPGLSEV